MKYFLFPIIVSFIALTIDFINCLKQCDDWTQYKSSKCFKNLEKTGSYVEAQKMCNDLGSTLLTVDDQEQMEFILELLNKSEELSTRAWVDKTNGGKLYIYHQDGSTYQMLFDGKGSCPKIILGTHSGSDGWQKSSCARPAIVVCEKKQELDLDSVQDLLKILQEQIDELKKSQVPIGFIYVQLPGQSDPQTLWPNTEWNNISPNYAGLFFRTEGDGAEKFGIVQGSNHPRLSKIKAQSSDINGVSYKAAPWKTYDIKEGGWTDNLVAKTFNANMEFYFTSDENRPRNMAIKIWIRIK